MTSPFTRPGRLSVALALLCAASIPAFGQSEIRAAFDSGVELLKQGDKQAALREFQRVLAMDPSHEACYELMKETDHQVWLELLTERGELELVGRRLMDLARLGRSERVDDQDKIAELVDSALGEDPVARRRAVLSLAELHGEFAVPRLLVALGDQGDEERRVLAIHTLTEMGSPVVPPLVAALRSDDPFLRRQVAYTLGYIGDRRALPALARHASADEDGGAAQAASESLARLGGSPDALALYLEQGAAYRRHDSSVLAPGLRSAVVWSWDGALRKRAVPGYLWPDEMAKQAFYGALEVSPASTEALAGIAAAHASQIGQLEARARAGADAGDLLDQAAAGMLAVSAVGPEALDLALGRALERGDEAAAAVLCRALGNAGGTAGASLARASQTDGPVRGEAAVAMAGLAASTGATLAPDVVLTLARTASREVQRIAGIVDPDAQRVAVLRGELEARGVVVRAWDKGAVALASMRRSPGFDLVVVAQSLPDLTVTQVLGEIRADDASAEIPVLMAAGDRDAAEELYSDHVAGFLTTDDLSALDDALSGELTGERAAALELASRAARALASARADLIPAQGMLLEALSRDDAVVLPLLQALGRGGDGNAVEALAAVVADGDRTDDARIAAADALCGVLARHPGTGAVASGSLAEVAQGDAPARVREAACRALGRVGLDPAARASLLEAVRVSVGE